MPKHPRVSPFVESLSASVFSRLAERAREKAGVVYPLHVGDTYLQPPPSAHAEAQRSDEIERLHNYAPVQGDPELLDAIVEKLRRDDGVEIERDLIQVTSGATAGLAQVCAALLHPGDEVLLPSPYWPLIRGSIASRGAVAREVPLYTRLDDPDFDARAALEAALTHRTVALYLNSPHNPTGTVLPDRVVETVAELARKHDLWVISDDVYDDLWYTPERPTPVWRHPALQGRVIASHSVSKSHALAGARVGFTHGPAEAMRAVAGVQTFHTYCAPRPMQHAATRALREGDAWLADARAAYAQAGRHAAEALGIEPPQGGTFLFFDASPYLREGEDVAGVLERCMEVGVLLTPGRSSGADFDTWARLSFTAVPPDELDEALQRLRGVLER